MTSVTTLRGIDEEAPRHHALAWNRSDRVSSAIETGGMRVAILGNALPRRCGIATFTTDLHAAISTELWPGDAMIVAMNDQGSSHAYPPSVAFTIPDQDVESYRAAARRLDAMDLDAVSLQHEFGIFGGRAGSHILELAERLDTPLITTLHTVLARPDAAQHAVLTVIGQLSRRLVVMSERGRQMLCETYAVPAAKIDVIAHGIPDLPFADTALAKAALGYAGRSVVLTFGLLAPSKGIEFMIEAMPQVLAGTPNAVYVVLGATHPNLLRTEGEAYRERLHARVRALGIEDSVVFLDRFVDQATLLEHIAMCDVYVTPYLNEEQLTSGTLAYSFGLGKAVVSTPYWHAMDLLSEGLGRLVPFGNVDGFASAVRELLENAPVRDAICREAYAKGRDMTWSSVGRSYLQAFTRSAWGAASRQPTARQFVFPR
jgi:glycosyltransferase involved in cell wall biosynthesis